MPYAQLQFLAYVLNTGYKQALPAPAPANPCYRGLADPAQDIAARVALVKRAIETAAADPTLLGGADTLKVFMMPEFFFRGNTGAYDLASVQTAIAALQALVATDDWDDWLFIFGTVVGYSEPHDKDISWTDWFLNMVSSTAVVQPSDIYNFSLVHMGGAAPGDADTHVVMKDSISNQDFIPKSKLTAGLPLVPPGLLLAENTRYVTAGAAGRGRENQYFNNDGSGIFNAAGIRFGMEICLDHALKRLVRSPQIPGDTRVQVQLVPSCGMSLKEPALLIDASGLAFCCDGAGWGATAGAPNALPATALVGTVVPLSAAALDTGGAAVAVNQLFGPGFAFPGAGSQGVLGAAAGTEAGAIVVYPVVATPAASIVPGLTSVFTYEGSGYQVEVVLIYDAQRRFTGASGKISNQDAGLNDLAHMLPMTLTGIGSDGLRGAIALTLRKGGAGFDYGIQCESNLTGFGLSGVVLEFGKTYGSAFKTTWTQVPEVADDVV
jgi:hypothetical protein